MIKKTTFWKDKKCLVTGGIGFIGSHLCNKLCELTAQVITIDIEPPHPGTLFYILNKNKKTSTIDKNLSDRAIIDVVQQIRPDYIFHLAALPYAPYTTSHPLESYYANVVSTFNILEAARLLKINKFILASSACVFGATERSPLKVDDEPSPPEHYYSYTKQEAEKHVKNFNDLYGINASICRFTNVYGPGDRHFGRIVPQMCYQLIKENRNTLQLKRSKGDSVFEFLYVNDAVDALLLAAERKSSKLEVFHFGPGEEARINVLNLARKISLLFDGRTREIVVNKNKAEKKVEKYLDVSTTKAILGWYPHSKIEDMLELTVRWYKNYFPTICPYENEVD